jgi:hypothetical protein
MNLQNELHSFNLAAELRCSLRIEPAYQCDGSLCHQPLFDEAGGLRYVAPHCHLVEWGAGGRRYHAVLCDFPI